MPSAGPDREVLRRRVRVAAAGVQDLPGFFDRLRAVGVRVRERFSQHNPGEVTGYAVALWTHDASSIWFGGGKLAPDLTVLQLLNRWTSGTPRTTPYVRRVGREERGLQLSPFERERAWKHAQVAARTATEQIAASALRNPAAAADAAWAASDLLAVAARLVQGRGGGPLTSAAEEYERAGRELYRRAPKQTSAGYGVRSASGLLSAARVPQGHRGRAAQAAAARSAADGLLSESSTAAPDRFHRPVDPCPTTCRRWRACIRP